MPRMVGGADGNQIPFQLGLINSSLLALEHMDQTKGGRGGLVVNISSVAGLQPTPLMAIYSAAKHGVTAFTRGLAVSTGEKCILQLLTHAQFLDRMPLTMLAPEWPLSPSVQASRTRPCWPICWTRQHFRLRHP